ncbi:MAG: LegC family aminotransferase [Prolixibacteraceae bacterium]|jgi:dTDP-4-amino-4,6-dideoxygalactose transaminase|nr:LegC family aminotransferase [Prolixibacteraceae bacterium]
MHSDLTSFIRSTFHEPNDFIPLHDPRFIGNEKKYLNDCIDSNFVSSVGEFVGRFEKQCAEYTGSKFAVAAMNGTAALHIALQLAGVQREDEVITQALTFIATTNAISFTGAKPVFVDVDRETMGLSPTALENWLLENVEMRPFSPSPPLPTRSERRRNVTQSPHHPLTSASLSPFNKYTGKRIAACVPMHTFGHPVKMEGLLGVCDRYNIPLVEDAAESLGSTYKGNQTGTFGKLGILSFNGNKIITTGGGGMILTDNEELAKLAKHLTTQAKVPHQWEFVHDQIGYNYRLTNVNAAIGCAQMESLDYLLQLKRELAEKYKEFFKDSEFTFFTEPTHCRSNYWLNAILTKDRKQRDELLEYTNKNGVMTRPVWELMNRLPMFADCQTDNLENSVWFADRVVNIPSSAIVPGYRK